MSTTNPTDPATKLRVAVVTGGHSFDAPEFYELFHSLPGIKPVIQHLDDWGAAKSEVRATAPWTLLIPEGGVSLLDVPGQPFHDPVADAALFTELDRLLDLKPGRKVISRSEAINEFGFATATLGAFRRLAPQLSLKPS